MINHVFDQGKTTLAHLACALGSNEIVTVLMKRAGNGSNTIWTQKDDDGRYTFFEGGREMREREREREMCPYFYVSVTF